MSRYRHHPTYHSGFARTKHQAKHAWAWEDAALLMSPALGPTGYELKDWSGNRNHGTLTGMTLADAWTVHSGRHCITTDGSDDRIATAAFNLGTGPCSIGMWFRVTSTTGERFLVDSTNNAGGSPGILLDYRGDLAGKNIGIYFGDFTAGFDSIAVTTGDVSDGLWHHVVALRDGSLLRYYLDGTQRNTTTDNARSLTMTQPLTIGGPPTIAGFRFGGDISEVVLMKRDMSASEVQARYQLGPGGIFALADQPAASVAAAARIARGASMTGGMYPTLTGGMVA